MSTEHTQGSLTKEAIRLAWPAVCESFFIALAGMVDTFMVSTLGANAVAAVGLTTQPKFLGLALFRRTRHGLALLGNLLGHPSNFLIQFLMGDRLGIYQGLDVID